MIWGIEVPLEMASLAGAICLVAGMWTGQRLSGHRDPTKRGRAAHPLHDLLKPEILTQTIDLTARRSAIRARARSVLHGRVDHHGSIAHHWGNLPPEQVRDHISSVMRAGLRQGDRFAMGRHYDFTISVAGADERAALKIADRLRRRLARLRLGHAETPAQLSVNFGVAASHADGDARHLGTLARRALQIAMARGGDHIVPASEIAEVRLLPAPTPSPVDVASAA